MNSLRNYRPNPERAVYLTGHFDVDLFSKVLPDIVRLRAASDLPITVYINSGGGENIWRDLIFALLTAPDLQGQRGSVITVVPAFAASAAAVLTVYGDYSYVYPEAILHFHGSRFSKKEDVTFENARQTADELETQNHRIARRVSNSVFRRILFRIQQLTLELDVDADYDLVQFFVEKVGVRISNRAKHVVDTVFGSVKERIGMITVCSDSVQQPAWPEKSSFEKFMCLLTDQLTSLPNRDQVFESWPAAEPAVLKAVRSVCTLSGWAERVPLIDEAITTYGLEFLGTQERKDYDVRRANSPAAAKAYLAERLEWPFRVLWVFTTFMCQQLHSGENGLTPQDAYWMGLIDEVWGENLMSERVFMERSETEVAPAAAAPGDMGDNTSTDPPSLPPPE